MKFTVDLDSEIPLYLQLKGQIIYAICIGELRPGDSLPSIRQLEAELGINRNTIRTAYLELQHEGMLVLRWGKHAEVAPSASYPHPSPVTSVRYLAQKMIREVESHGIDSLSFASALEQTAAAHDRLYPKCAFVECSQDQADGFAQAVETAWNRTVLGMDIHPLREDPRLLRPSIKCILTSPRHLTEVKELLGDRIPAIYDVRSRLSQQFYEGVQRLVGLRVGLILRDPESVEVYRERVQRYVKPKELVGVALLGEREKAIELMRSVEGVVHTTVCRRLVMEHAPPDLLRQEFLYEPFPEDLERLKEGLFTT